MFAILFDAANVYDWVCQMDFGFEGSLQCLFQFSITAVYLFVMDFD